MYRKELNERNPLRLFEHSIHGGLGPGNIGVVVARHGIGTGFESFMVLGKDIFLICNNTVQSMDGIAQDPKWLGAQVPFVELSEKFRDHPLVFREPILA